MVAHEDLAHRRVAEQEGAEGLGEHVLRADGVPDLARHLVVLVARWRHAAEVAVGDVLDLVVVVEDHLAVARDAEVLPQHVAGEDVGRDQVLDGVAVLDDGALDLLLLAGGRGVLQVDVQRDHAPLDVEVADQQQFAVFLHQAGAEVAQLGDQFLVEAVAREGDVAVLQRVGHAADAVVLLHQQVLGLDLLARGVLLRRVEVLDDLEDVGEGRQVEHQHHHALDAGRDAEAVARVPQVGEEVAVEEVLAVLLQAERAVELVARLARHQAAQELHVGARHLHVDHEVGAREAEDDQQLVLAEQRRVDDEPARLAVQQRQAHRDLGVAVDHLGDDIGALVAEEERTQHLDLEVGAQQPLADGQLQVRLQRLEHGVHVARQVLELALELEVVDDADQRLAQVLARGVVGAVGRQGSGLVVLDVLGADGRAHEDELVAEVAARQQLGRDRVEEGLGQLGLVVVGQQADVVQLGLLPGVLREGVDGELVAQARHGLIDTLVVVLDALALGALLAVPVGLLEALLRPGAGGAEQAVVAVEALQHGARDVEGAAVGQGVREHRAAPGGLCASQSSSSAAPAPGAGPVPGACALTRG